MTWSDDILAALAGTGGTTQHLLLHLAAADGWLTATELAERAGYSERTVHRNMPDLVAAEHARTRFGYSRPQEWRIDLPGGHDKMSRDDGPTRRWDELSRDE
jgi:predicted ArsR family transcriptional regulator